MLFIQILKLRSHKFVKACDEQVKIFAEKENLGKALGLYSDESATFSFIVFECIKCNLRIFIFDLKKKT